MASLGMEKGLEPPRPQASSKAYLCFWEHFRSYRSNMLAEVEARFLVIELGPAF
jgi:hypothetical protein